MEIVNKIEENLLTCPICLELAFNAGSDFHSLPCQHQICEVCIKDMLERKRKNEKLKCPVCRKQFDLSSNQMLPTFRYASELSELINSMRDELDSSAEPIYAAVGCEKVEKDSPHYHVFEQYDLTEHIAGFATYALSQDSKL